MNFSLTPTAALSAAPLVPATRPLSVVIGRKAWPVSSLQEASELFCVARDAWGEGASGTPVPVVCREGVPFGHISYNGRVWGHLNGPDWRKHLGDVPLYDPC